MTLAKSAFGLNRILLASVACLAVAACGAQQSDDPISVVGSSTVYPFAQKVAVDMVAADKGVAEPVITSTGSSEGIEAFCQGVGPDTPDIVNASRRMSVAEFTLCQKSGVEEIIEVKIGLDGIVFASAREGGIDLSLTSDAVYKALAANPFGKEQLSANWRGQNVMTRSCGGITPLPLCLKAVVLSLSIITAILFMNGLLRLVKLGRISVMSVGQCPCIWCILTALF